MYFPEGVRASPSLPDTRTEALCAVLGVSSAGFESNALRCDRRAELDALLRPAIAEWDRRPQPVRLECT